MRLINQNARNSCNVACVRMILDHYGMIVSEETIRTLLPKHTFGSTIDEIERCLSQYGLLTTQYPSNINGSSIPDGIFVVGVVNDNNGRPTPHYIVVQKRHDICDVYDPQEREMTQATTSHVLVLSRKKEQKNAVWLHTMINNAP